MQVSVRCFLLDAQDHILLVQHTAEGPRVLPGGHAEPSDETIYDTLRREIREELAVDIDIIGAENSITQTNVVMHPLPISIHTVTYTHRKHGETTKFEYLFFARAKTAIKKPNSEIHTWARKWIDEVLALEDAEIPPFLKEVLEQNVDLLEIIG